MPGPENAVEWRFHSMIDRNGEKIGQIEEIFLDAETRSPEWALVELGLLGTRSAFVPLEGASLERGAVFERRAQVRVPYEKEAVKNAPNIGRGEPSVEEEQQLRRHYSAAWAAGDVGEEAPAPAEGSPGYDELEVPGRGAGRAATAASGMAAAQPPRSFEDRELVEDPEPVEDHDLVTRDMGADAPDPRGFRAFGSEPSGSAVGAVGPATTGPARSLEGRDAAERPRSRAMRGESPEAGTVPEPPTIPTEEAAAKGEEPEALPQELEAPPEEPLATADELEAPPEEPLEASQEPVVGYEEADVPPDALAEGEEPEVLPEEPAMALQEGGATAPGVTGEPLLDPGVRSAFTEGAAGTRVTRYFMVEVTQEVAGGEPDEVRVEVRPVADLASDAAAEAPARGGDRPGEGPLGG